MKNWKIQNENYKEWSDRLFWSEVTKWSNSLTQRKGQRASFHGQSCQSTNLWMHDSSGPQSSDPRTGLETWPLITESDIEYFLVAFMTSRWWMESLPDPRQSPMVGMEHMPLTNTSWSQNPAFVMGTEAHRSTPYCPDKRKTKLQKGSHGNVPSSLHFCDS
jgi:hypothetical protein